MSQATAGYQPSFGSVRQTSIRVRSPRAKGAREIRVARASSKTTIHAPADAIWQVISGFDAACHYLAMVVICTVCPITINCSEIAQK
jgi:hypothetical protein